jgi:molybdate transport system substrate-binding protein
MGEDFSSASGHVVNYTFSNPANLNQALMQGSYDAIVVATSSVDELDKAGRLQPGSRARVGRGGIGVVVREGAPKPDLSTPDAFKRTVLNARNVVHGDPTTLNGSGVIAFAILAEAGLLDAVKAKATQANLVMARELIAKGDYEIGLMNLSEAAGPGVAIAGPVPAPLQKYTVYDVALFRDAAAKEAAADYLRYIASPAARQRWTDALLEQTAR